LIRSDFNIALRQIDSFIDISEDDLNQIYQLASEFDHQQKQQSSFQ